MKLTDMLYQPCVMEDLNWIKVNQIKTPLLSHENLGKVIAFPRKIRSYNQSIDNFKKPQYDVGILELYNLQQYMMFGEFTSEQTGEAEEVGYNTKLAWMFLSEKNYDKRATYYTLSHLDASKWRAQFIGAKGQFAD